MIVRFRLTANDLVAFYKNQFFQSPFIIAMYAGVIGLVFVEDLLTKKGWRRASFDTVLTVVFTLVFLQVLMAVTARLKRNTQAQVDQTLTFGEEGFTTESVHGKGEVKWSIVQNVARTKRHFFLYVSGTSAITIPATAFADAQSADEFWALCRRKTNA